MGTGEQFVLAFDFMVLIDREYRIACLTVASHLNGSRRNINLGVVASAGWAADLASGAALVSLGLLIVNCGAIYALPDLVHFRLAAILGIALKVVNIVTA